MITRTAAANAAATASTAVATTVTATAAITVTASSATVPPDHHKLQAANRSFQWPPLDADVPVTKGTPTDASGHAVPPAAPASSQSPSPATSGHHRP